MSKAVVSIEGFVANELQVRNAGDHRVVEVSVPHTPQKKTEAGWEDSGPTTWFQGSFWDEHVDAVMDAAGKGSLVTLSGFPELEVYKRTNGEPGAKVVVKNPTIAVVVRRPKRGEARSAPVEPDDVWNTPGNYNDSTPF